MATRSQLPARICLLALPGSGAWVEDVVGPWVGQEPPGHGGSLQEEEKVKGNSTKLVPESSQPIVNVFVCPALTSQE